MARWLGWLLATLTLLAACSQPAIRPATSTIHVVGLIAEERLYGDKVVYTLESGQSWEAQAGTFRSIMNLATRLLVVGSDANGVWVATLGPQDGLPPDCNFTHDRGAEWVDAVAIAGVLWEKAPGFAADPMPSLGSDYPPATRFCMNENGKVTSTIPF